MSNILLSIIIPVYNTAFYLPTCLNSIMKQLNKTVEVIIINDGSTDDSLTVVKDIVNNYPSNNITLISQDNKGLSAARNLGIGLAKGKYVFFVDSDDSIYKNSIKVLIDSFEASTSEVFTFNYKALKNNNRTKRHSIKKNYSNLIESMPNPLSNVWRYVCSRHFILEHRLFFRENILCEDIDWCVRMFLSEPSIFTIYQYLYEYNQRISGTIMSAPSARRIRDAFGNIEFSHKLLTCNSTIRQIVINNLADIFYYTMAQIPSLQELKIEEISTSQTCEIVRHANRTKDRIMIKAIEAFGFKRCSYLLYYIKKVKG